MPGLLDMLQGNYSTDPDQNAAVRQGLLATGLGLLASRGSFGQALGQAGMQGLGAYEGYQDATISRRLKKAQLDDVDAQFKLRLQQAAKQEEALKMARQLMAPQADTSASTALSMGAQAGSVGPTVDNAARMNAMPQGSPQSFMSRLNEDQITGLIASGALPPQTLEVWKLTKFGEQMQPGYRRNVDGTTTYMPNPKDGIDFQNGKVTPLPGALNTSAAQTVATELPKAIINSGMKREDFTNPDGTMRSMTGLQFGQEGGGLDALQKLLGPLTGAQPAPQPMRPPQQPTRPVGAVPPAAPGAMPTRAQMVVPPAAQAARDRDIPTILQGELLSAQGRAAAARTPEEKQRAAGDVAAITAELNKAGVRSGVSNQTKIANNAAEAVNTDWLKTSYAPVLSAGDAAKDMLTSVQTARIGLAAAGPTGWGKEAQVGAAGVLSALGVPQAEKVATGAAIFQNAGIKQIHSVLNAATGVQTEGDAQRASKTFATLGTTPKANEFILDMAQAVAERNAKKAAFYREALPLAKQTGDLQEVDRRWMKLEPSVWSMPSLQKWGK